MPENPPAALRLDSASLSSCLMQTKYFISVESSHRKVKDCPVVPSDVVAVGSRSKEKADAYIKEVEGAEGAVGYGSYEEVLEDANVHAVYIPLPTSLHAKWVQAAAAKGKHILLEKPIAMVRNMLYACHRLPVLSQFPGARHQS